MKKITTSISTVIAGILPAATSYAASGAGEDNLGFFVWIFFIMCGLIIIGQLLPAALLILGFTKGLRKEEEKKIET